MDPLSLFAAEAKNSVAISQQNDGHIVSGTLASTTNGKKATDEISPDKNKSLADELADYEKSVISTATYKGSQQRSLSASGNQGTGVHNIERPVSFQNTNTLSSSVATISDRSDGSASSSSILVPNSVQQQTPIVGVPTVSALTVTQDVESTDDDIELLTGEANLMRLKNVSIQKPSGRHIPITLIMTTFRMMLVPSRSHSIALAGSNPSILSQLNVPLGCIEKIEREKKAKDSRVQGTTIIIQCKDIRSFRLYISGPDEQIHDGPPMSDSEIERAFNAMGAYAFPTDIRYVFAFVHFHALPATMKAAGPHLTYDCVVC